MASGRLEVVVEFDNGSLDDDSDSNGTDDEFRPSKRLGVVSCEAVLSSFEADQDMTPGDPDSVNLKRPLGLPVCSLTNRYSPRHPPVYNKILDLVWPSSNFVTR